MAARTPALGWLAVVVLAATMSCGRAPVAGGNEPCCVPATKPRVAGAGSPGFDKRDFPGLRAMEIWYATSPYEWVGYYLPSPCFAGTTWTGHRQELIDRRWGLAVLYVGLQATRNAVVSTDTTRAAAAAPPTRCSVNTLSADQGRLDGDDAVSVAMSDGFAVGTTIFLDVERAEPYPSQLDAYVRAWVAQVLVRKFFPGIYGHRVNADALYASQRAMYAAAGENRSPPFWVVNSQGFDLSKSPGESGFPFATVWQNPTDANETYGSVTFRIDRNVASTRSPSQ